jgi:acetolactate synthase-1/2/3 large subunit
MGHGYANATNGASLVALHDLVGLMHGVMGVYDAYAAHAPVVIIGGSGPADPSLRRAIDYVHSANVQGELIRPFVKWDDESVTAEGICDSIVRAHKIATTGPRGPVYVAIDAGVQEQKLDKPIALPDVTASYNQAPPPAAIAKDALDQAVEILLKAKNPVITCGRVSMNPAITQPLVSLVESLGATFHEDRNSVSFPSNHPQNLTGDKAVIKEADVVLCIDSYDVSTIVDAYSSRVRGVKGEGAAGKKVIDLSLNDYAHRSWQRLGGMVAPTAVQLLADPLEGTKQLAAAVKARLSKDKSLGKGIESRKAKIAKRKADYFAKQAATTKKRWDETPLSPHRFVSEIWNAVKGKPWFLTIRNHRNWPEGIWEFNGGGEYVGHSAGGGVGHGPGAMVGAAFAARDRGQFPIGILGDGDFMMSSGALWTAVHYKVPLLVIINNNLSWYNDEEHQVEVAHMRKRPPENAWIGTTTRDPAVDHSSLARGWGCWAEGPITDPDEFGPALKRAIKQVEAGKVAVLDVHTKAR